jgi:hypothetical protein
MTLAYSSYANSLLFPVVESRRARIPPCLRCRHKLREMEIEGRELLFLNVYLMPGQPEASNCNLPKERKKGRVA